MPPPSKPAPFVMVNPEMVTVLSVPTKKTALLAPLIARLAAPGPEIVMFLPTMNPSLITEIVPVTEKSIVSPFLAAAIASRSRQPEPGQFAAFATPSPVFCTVMVVAA